MFQHFVDKVGEFHTAFRVKPKSLIHNLELRVKLLWEEYNELKEANDAEEELDAITDMVYIASGTIQQYDPLMFHPSSEVAFSSVREVSVIMDDIEFTDSYNKFLTYHAELLYALRALAIEKNYDLFGAFNEVHSSNMSKLDDEGKPVLRSDGKVLKGPNFRPPRLEKFTVMEVKNEPRPTDPA